MTQEIKKDEEIQTHEGGEKETKVEEKVVQMTQAELDAIVSKSKNQVRNQFADYDELKAKAEAATKAEKDAELANMDELERTKTALTEKDSEVATLTEKIAALEKAQRVQAIETAFTTAAKAASIPEERMQDAKLLAGISDETDAETIGELVKKLVTEKPFLVVKEEKQQKQVGGASNGGSPKNEKTDEQLLQEAADQVRKYGRLEDKVKYANLKHKLGK
ncbi:hypothetical protein COM97_27015 [Bacillus thuringiensis]|uniref:hypothetical protein n=1 Tax=Bacillus thuringiensis TaxID=1428 RepID=UPI000BEB3740|nr:hypothetical protein [Bacillus thuringiensis]PEF03394.1 hypothetical protein COM97_27015 [Bacillus thuringiensis]